MNIEETKKAIEVMQAFVDGKEIEYRGNGDCDWTKLSIPAWDWSKYIYRIKPAEPKKVKLLAYISNSGELRFVRSGETWPDGQGYRRVPSEDKEVELP